MAAVTTAAAVATATAAVAVAAVAAATPMRLLRTSLQSLDLVDSFVIVTALFI